MSDIVPFQFPATGQTVRTVVIDGEPWWVIADACAILGHSNPSMAAARLDPDDLSVAEVIDSMGRTQRARVVNESGLYELIIRSDRPQAREFRRWITHEVIPAIRRTGSYSVEPAAPRELSRREMAQYWLEAETRAEVAEAKVAELEPAAGAWQSLASAEGDWSVREAAYILNRDHGIVTGERRLFGKLREWRLIDGHDTPYAPHQRHVKLRPRTYTDQVTGEERPAKSQVRITADGIAYLRKRFAADATRAAS